MSLLVLINAANAQPTALTACPEEAFFTNGQAPTNFSTINLTTGYTETFDGVFYPDFAVNAIGFDQASMFLYAGAEKDDGTLSIAKVGSDGGTGYEAEYLDISGVSANRWFVGDVYNATGDNGFYVFRQEGVVYFFEIDPLVTAFTATTVDPLLTIGPSWGLDIAFHPASDTSGLGIGYSISTSGGDVNLIRFEMNFGVPPADVTSVVVGSLTLIDDSEINRGGGPIGALYFDTDVLTGVHTLYATATQTGATYRWPIGLSLADATAGLDQGVFAAHLPAVSGNVDGARCPLADVSTIADYGDAPSSYVTTNTQGGPNHTFLGRTGSFWLGTLAPDQEVDITPPPNPLIADPADEIIEPIFDETTGEGAGFVLPTWGVGEERWATIDLNTFEGESLDSAYLNAFIDWDNDGVFGDRPEEVIAFNQPVIGPSKLFVPATAPDYASVGSTWSRWRISKEALGTALPWAGGGGIGEVEDHLTYVETTTTTQPPHKKNIKGKIEELFRTILMKKPQLEAMLKSGESGTQFGLFQLGDVRTLLSVLSAIEGGIGLSDLQSFIGSDPVLSSSLFSLETRLVDASRLVTIIDTLNDSGQLEQAMTVLSTQGFGDNELLGMLSEFRAGVVLFKQFLELLKLGKHE